MTHAWAAGFFDGEGCVTIRAMRTHTTAARSGHHYHPRLSACQVKTEPLLVLQELYGGRIHRAKPQTGNQRATWGWELSGAANVLAAAKALLPYLVVKHEQMECAIELCERIGPPAGGFALSGHELSIRRTIWERLQRLNQRGVQ